MNILLTGALGYLGSNYRTSLHSTSLTTYATDLKSAASVTHLDICKKISVRVPSPFGVINLAGIGRRGLGDKDPNLTHQVNVGGTSNLLEFCRRERAEWVILIGTNDSTSGPYTASKETARQIGKQFSTLGLKVGVLNLPYVYGGINEPLDRLIPRFLQQAIVNQTIRVDAPHLRFDFINVEDVVEGLQKFQSFLSTTNRTYTEVDLCTGVGTTIADLAEIVIEKCASSSELIVAPRELPYSPLPNPVEFDRLIGRFEKICLTSWLEFYDDNKHMAIQ
jgi:nucleoside-diphosphate-sugar epimerase